MYLLVKEVLAEKARRGAALFYGLGRGELVPWAEFEAAADTPRGAEHWRSVLKKVRRAVLEARGVVLLAVPGEGLKMATLDEQLNAVAAARQRRASRQLARGQREVGALPPRELSPAQARLKTFRLEEMARLRRLASESLRRQQAAATPPPPLKPLPPHLRERGAS